MLHPFRRRKNADTATEASRRTRRLRGSVLTAAFAGAMAAATFAATPATAQTLGCLDRLYYNVHDSLIKGSYTYSVNKSQATSTYQDWIWRGPTYKCPTSVPSCTYAWGSAKSTGYSISIGLSVTPGSEEGLPSLTPEYQYTSEITTSFTWSITMLPGQYAQPIQVVDRRWRDGYFEGAWVNHYQNCILPSLDVGTVADWRPSYAWGSWHQYVAVNNYATYYVHS
ncbi:hypothetical protein ABH941_006398 [Streptacidiphilus sp. EB103A]